MFTVGWVYELPFGKGLKYNMSGFLNAAFGGWKINGTYAKYTGTPYWVTGSSTTTRCARGCGTNGAELIGPIVKIDQERGAAKPYLDPSAFRDPLFWFNANAPVYRFGSIGKGILHGPGYWQLNPAVYKNFRVTERVNAEFRAESFNCTNTPRWGNPNNGAGAMRLDANGNLRTDIPYATALGNFMTITSASTGRQFRFGMRVSF
jgi:hypothetical protein